MDEEHWSPLMPQVFKKVPKVFNGRVVAFDVDDTLVHWVPDGIEPPEGALAIPWPAGGVQWCTPIKDHILAVQHHGRQEFDVVIVWSQGGEEWASNVVTALGLEWHVDIVVGKPQVHYDDLPSSEWMGERRHIPLKVGSVKSVSRLLKDDED